MKKLFPFGLFIVTFLVGFGQSFSFDRQGSVVILFDNDVHGAVEGYPYLAALRDSIQHTNPNVLTVSCGDFLSGTALGSQSQGGYIVRLMNAVGYDFVTLGNHEFDYGIPMLEKRLATLNAQALCCNFVSLDDSSRLLGCSAQYTAGKHRLVFIGLTTPNVPTTSTPKHFQDSLGNWQYTFFPTTLDSLLQAVVDSVRNDNSFDSTFVVLISHVGSTNLPPLIAATHGVDLVLDGHSHDVIRDSVLFNSLGHPVHWTSTGSKFKNIGQVELSSKGDICCSLIPLHGMSKPHNRVQDTLEAILSEYQAIGQRKVGFSEVPLYRVDTLSSTFDCTLGNFFADAYRTMAKAEIGLMNRGGIRDDIKAGELLHYHLHTVAPFNNRTVLVSVSGRCLLDALEFGCHRWPKISGPFLHVSGIKYQIDTTLKTDPAQLDENGILVSINGPRRVKNVFVWDVETQKYLPLDPDRRYTVAGSDYYLLNHGDGHNFYDVRVLNHDLGLDVDALEWYVQHTLHGRIGRDMGTPQGRITASSPLAE